MSCQNKDDAPYKTLDTIHLKVIFNPLVKD